MNEAVELYRYIILAPTACCWRCLVLLRVVVCLAMLCDTLRSIFFGLPTVVPLRGLAQLSCIFLLQLFVFFYYADCCTQRMCLPQHIAAAAVVHLFVITRMIGNNSQGPLLSWEDEAGELFVLGAEVAAACC